jgi:hypothetical protein
MTLRTDYTNATGATDAHPAAHNDANAAVNMFSARKIGPPGYWVSAFPQSTTANNAYTAGWCRVTRGYWAQTVDALGADVTTPAAAGATVTGIVYAMLANGLPGALVAKSIAVDAGAVGYKLLPLDVPMPAGLYYVGVLVLAANPTLRCLSMQHEWLATANQNQSTSGYNCYSLTGQTVAPNPWPTTVASAGQMATIAVRFA